MLNYSGCQLMAKPSDLETTEHVSAPDDLAAELGELMIELMQRIHAHIDQQCAAAQLTRQQALMLALLRRPQPMGALAAALHCDASNVTGLADRLERRGLVERQSDPSDRRVKLLALTPAGTALEEDLRARIWRDSPIVAGLPYDRQQLLRDLLRAALTDQAADG